MGSVYGAEKCEITFQDETNLDDTLIVQFGTTDLVQPAQLQIADTDCEGLTARIFTTETIDENKMYLEPTADGNFNMRIVGYDAS